MTSDQEQVLFTTLGRIEEKLDNCVETLSSHTLQDSDNFLRLEQQMNDIRNRQIREIEGRINALHLLAAKKEGEDIAIAKLASTSGGKMGGIVASVISVIISAVVAYFNK